MHFQGGSSLHWPPFFTLCIYTLITQGNPDPPQTSVERSVHSRRNNYDAGNNNVSWHYSPNPPVLERARMERCSTRPGLVCKRGAEKCIKQSFNSHFKCVSSYYIATGREYLCDPFHRLVCWGDASEEKPFFFFFSLGFQCLLTLPWPLWPFLASAPPDPILFELAKWIFQQYELPAEGASTLDQSRRDKGKETSQWPALRGGICKMRGLAAIPRASFLWAAPLRYK